MPCINNTNGQPVPGRRGSCPVGSHWVMSEQDQQLMRENEGGGLQNIGDWFTPGGAVKAGLGIASLPFIKGGFNVLKNKAKDPNNLKKLQNLKNKLFKRFDQPVRPKYPIMNKAQEKAWRKANPGKWLLDKWKLTGWGGAGTAGLAHLMDQMGGGETEEKKPLYPGGFMNTEQHYQQTAGQQAPPPEPNAMQKAMANMKDPKFWMESMSDDPNDTKLMRIGQLMSHYGKPTERMRAQAGTPQEKWAENAARAKGSSSSYTALKNMILSPSEITKQIYIDAGGLWGLGGMDTDERKAAAQARGNAINALMHELAMAGKLPTMENARALFYARNPDKDPRNKKKKPEDEELWYQFWN